MRRGHFGPQRGAALLEQKVHIQDFMPAEATNTWFRQHNSTDSAIHPT